MEIIKQLIENQYHENFHWCNRNIYISNNRMIKFNEEQLAVFSEKDNKKAFLMPRQSGKSTIICADALATAMKNKNIRIAILSPLESSSAYLFEKIKYFIDESNLKDIMDIAISKSSRSFKFDNGTIIQCYCANNRLGLKVDACYIDDFDYIDDENLSSVMSLINNTDKVLVLGSNNLDRVSYLNNLRR